VDDGALSNLSSLCVSLSLLLVFVDPTDHASLPFFEVKFVWVEEISEFWSNPYPFLHIGLLVFSPTAKSCLVLYLYWMIIPPRPPPPPIASGFMQHRDRP
jgi:hypothetical protein